MRYLDADGSTLGEEALDEPFPPAYTTAPGQTARRQIVRFDLPGVAGPVRDPDLGGRLFTDLESCEVVGDVMASPVSVDMLIDPAWADQVELEACGLDDEGDRFEGTFRVTNTSEEAVDVGVAFEILDAEGDRLGIGGNESYPVGPSEQAEIVGWAASFTVVDLDRAEDCALLTLSAS